MPGPKAPTGQVVATVDGEEVTFLELQSELAGFNTQDPKIRKAAEQRALENIIVRRILARAARDQKLDKTPDFALKEKRGTEGLLAQTLQNKMVSQIPEPSPDEAQRFMSDHPDIFAQRKLFTVDAIRMARPSDVNILRGLQPLKTLADVDSYLTVNKVPHARAAGTIDAVGADPRLVAQIVKLPPNEVFLYPQDNGFMVDQVRETQVVPFTGDPAAKYALSVIKRQRTQDAVQRQLRQTVASGMRTVQYNAAYKPPPPLAQPAAAPPAAKPAP